MSIKLIEDTTVVSAVAATDKKIVITANGPAVLRSSPKLDGSAVIALYYEGPDGTVDNPCTDDDGDAVTLTPENPERMINVPGTYRVAVTAAATTKGVVFVDR